MTLPPSSSDFEPLPAEPEPTWLDEEHVLEPLGESDPDAIPAEDPVVVDATGRMWRLRRRPAGTRTMSAAAPLLLGLLLLVLLLVLRV